MGKLCGAYRVNGLSHLLSYLFLQQSDIRLYVYYTLVRDCFRLTYDSTSAKQGQTLLPSRAILKNLRQCKKLLFCVLFIVNMFILLIYFFILILKKEKLIYN